jgi:flagellar biosynthesis component FlhA
MEENKLNVNTLSILVPIALIGVVLMFFVPLPTFLLMHFKHLT